MKNTYNFTLRAMVHTHGYFLVWGWKTSFLYLQMETNRCALFDQQPDKGLLRRHLPKVQCSLAVGALMNCWSVIRPGYCGFLSLGYFIILLLNEYTTIYRDLGKNLHYFIPRGKKRRWTTVYKAGLNKFPFIQKGAKDSLYTLTVVSSVWD